MVLTSGWVVDGEVIKVEAVKFSGAVLDEGSKLNLKREVWPEPEAAKHSVELGRKIDGEQGAQTLRTRYEQ